ncbi:MAG TPA: LPS export ABC transporter periplasmic protein LptC [Ferrovibrio sp.]|uniref:LPS export ABC transporter periplasmic protein LptC n=1 Tax=Ferrovibrio sp. TaxID=1917215 RepID=UPI002ED3DB63
MAGGIEEAAEFSVSRHRRVTEFAPRNSEMALTTLTKRRRYVHFMKFVLPLLALGTVAVLVAWPQLAKRHVALPLTFSEVDTAEAALVMNNPRYRGTDAKDQPYVVTADRAIQDPQDKQQVTMDNVQADLTMNNGAWWSLTADTGLYHGGTKLLNLFGNINVYGDNGYQMHGTSAEVNLNTDELASDEKVWGQSDLGMIRANGLRIRDKGRVIIFINGVNTTILPGKKRG